MQEHRAAAPGNTRRSIVVDLDNEIVEVIVARQPVATVVAVEPHRLVVMAVVRGLPPGVFRANRANGQKRPGPPVTGPAPPHPPRGEPPAPGTPAPPPRVG